LQLETGHLDIMGTPGERVVLAEYDARWPDVFEREAARVRDAVGDVFVTVEHIGSTSVPGLAAKPIVDIMPGVARAEDGERAVEPLLELGYESWGAYGIPGRWLFPLSRDGRRVVNMHVFAVDSWDYERHILFRDHLRRDPAARDAYEQLKRDLAAAHPHDRDTYTDKKTNFIEKTLRSR